MNHVSLRGRLAAEIETHNYVAKDGSTGVVVAFTLAVPDRTAKKNADGNFPADFIRCSAFGKNAEVLEAYCTKGTEILITDAKLTSGSYTKDGVTVFSTEVNIITFEFVGGTKTKESTNEKREKETKK